MRVAGVAVAIPTPNRPKTRLVVIEDATPGVIEIHAEFTADDVDLATQLHDAGEAVGSRLDGLGVDRVVVRRADRPPRASNAEGPRLRLLTEGAVTAAARAEVVDTRVGTGKETGIWHGTNKATLDGAARAVLTASGLDEGYCDAAAAALAGLALP
jgi:hypothetical protein